jgi:hypothetical protein
VRAAVGVGDGDLDGVGPVGDGLEGDGAAGDDAAGKDAAGVGTGA